MASSLLKLKLITITILLTTFCFPEATANSPSTSPFAQRPIIESVLVNLGFHELARAVPSLYDNPAFTAWSGPITLFLPTESSSSCSPVRLLREHTIPGLYSHGYLRKAASDSKIETIDHGRCITVTSSTDHVDNYSRKIFIQGVEITRPDMFNNALVIVHGLEGCVAPLSLYSCNAELMTRPLSLQDPKHVMRLMLKDATLRLRNSGFGVLALPMRSKLLKDLLNLQNMTVFAVDDESIFSGSHSYVDNLRHHIIPNRLLDISDLEKISPRTVPPTLEAGQSLMVTLRGEEELRINYVEIELPDFTCNLKIVVHSIGLPFPYLHPSAVETG
ncbi:fasciclin-like arabinogalactan protein 21 [Bidens hawaiensis]|uniref:fasciclin-like arabinogalactan protein 21 n=1 Tax=Bidens hawaiensis TaxID=980011 RepID=UPI004048FAB8